MRTVDELTLFAYRLLGEEEAASLKAHVDTCASCLETVERIEAESRLLGASLVRPEPDPLERGRVIDAVIARRSPARIRRATAPFLGLLRFLTLAAAVVAVALLMATWKVPAPAPAPEVLAGPPRREVLAYVQDAGVGSIAAQDEQGRPVGDLGLRSQQVSVEILDGVAKTTVDENFENHTDRRLEGVFRFPLPADASISRLALEVDGKIEEGTCLERERARGVFESIVSRMKDPALLEWMPGGIFQCRIFPIEPRSTKRVIVAYTQALPSFRGRMTYAYPLASEKTSAHPPGELKIEVEARVSGVLSRFESTSHRVDVQRRGPGEARMTFAVSGVRPRNDFVVAIDTMDEEIRFVPHKVDGDDGYFALFLSPRGEPARRPGRYALVLDISASVTAPELDVAKRLVRAFLERRIPGDRFEILAHHIDVLRGGEVDLRAANDFMDGLRSEGGSDVLGALQAAPEGEIVYIGRGRPTYGETDPARILEAVRGRRIRTVGVGAQANVEFLRKLGGQLHVSPNDDIPRRVAEIAATLGCPVLSGIEVSGGDSVYDVTGIRDVFYGERLMVAGRYRGQAAKLVVTGRDYRRELEVALPAREDGNNYVRRLWAQRRIADLLARGETTKPQVTALGIKHQIMTPYTSFLVLENERMWEDHQLKREVQPQDAVLSKGAPVPGFERFTLVSNGATQAIDLPRIAEGRFGSSTVVPLSRIPATFSETRTITNQFGGLEFTLSEARRAPGESPGVPILSELPMLGHLFDPVGREAAGYEARPDPTAKEDLRGMEASVFPLKYLQPPPVYRAKVEHNKFISGQPLQPPVYPEELLRRFEVLEAVKSVLTKDAEGKPVGTLIFDPQTNCLIVRDSPAVMERVRELVAALDVEPEQVLLDFKIVATSNREFLNFALAGDTIAREGEAPVPSAPAGVNRLPFGGSRDGSSRGGPGLLSRDDAAMVFRVLREDPHSYVIQEPTLALVDNTEATVFVGEGRSAAGAGFRFTVVPRIVPDSGKVIVSFIRPEEDVQTRTGGVASGAAAPRVSPATVITRLIMESGLTAVLEGMLPDRSLTEDRGGPKVGGTPPDPERVLIFVTPRIVRTGGRSSDSLQKLLRLREDEERRSSVKRGESIKGAPPAGRETREPGPSVLSADESSKAIVLGSGVNEGVDSGQFFALTRAGAFVGIVRILESMENRSRGEVWRGLSVGRILPGDAAKRLGDVQAYLAELPTAVRLDLASRANLDAIRARMKLRE